MRLIGTVLVLLLGVMPTIAHSDPGPWKSVQTQVESIRPMNPCSRRGS
jgi:hypothetical protein